jgi:hypothetical protein
MWLGEQDPVKSMDQARRDDPERNAARELVEHWKECLGCSLTFTARDIIDRASAGSADDGGPWQFDHPAFHELLLDHCAPHGKVESKSLAKWLTKIVGQVHNGHSIEVTQESGRGHRYKLKLKGGPRQAEIPF